MSRLSALVPPVKLAYDEHMRGECALIESPLAYLGVDLQLRLVLDSVLALQNPLIARVEGTIDVEGIATKRPIEGALAYRFDERRVPYSFSFYADEGRKITFRAQKDFSVFRVAEFVGRLEGTLYTEGPVELARLSLRRPVLSGLSELVRSLRVSVGAR